jgi:hypothetical protein
MYKKIYKLNRENENIPNIINIIILMKIKIKHSLASPITNRTIDRLNISISADYAIICNYSVTINLT